MVTVVVMVGAKAVVGRGRLWYKARPAYTTSYIRLLFEGN
jgi:hypothetical protein